MALALLAGQRARPSRASRIAGPTKIRAIVNLSAKSDTLTGNQYIEGFDTKGVLVFIGEVDLDGTRIHAEEPPE